MCRIEGPHVKVASRAAASKAAAPLRAACVMCSVYMSFGSSYTPSTRIAFFSSAIWWPSMLMVEARSSAAWRRYLMKWIS